MNTNFNKEFWENFISVNKNFTQTCVIKNVIPEELIKKLKDAVVDGLINRFKTKDLDGFRLYFPSQGKGKENADFIDELYKNPPFENEEIIEYCNRVFKEKFGLIVNFLEKHSNFISKELRLIAEPLLEIIGIPATGVDVTVFIGNYGWTPLGIHQDHKGENVLHFHLGPGEKTMYIWDQEKYKDLTGTKHNNFEIEPLLEHAEKYDFGAGDLFFMPWDKFHIGKSDDLSVGVTFWFNNPSKIKFFDRVLNTFYTDYIDLNKDVIAPQHNYLQNNETFDEFISLLKLDEDILNGSTRSFFKHLYDEYKHGLLSNAGWQAPPQSREKEDKYNIDDYEFLLEKEIHTNEPFKMIYKVDEAKETFYLFVRGSKIEMRYHPELKNIVDNLNTHKNWKVSDLLENLKAEWPVEAGLYFLSMIYDKKGIEVVGESKTVIQEAENLLLEEEN
ncbi:hypothetical protein SD427_13680 [Chryseobacterium sp. JJR-5R]|uniref:hypothetical protein n=1 Tax=Chryseobacterium sp. JJR-5R TaxID=3093923 RepID=UPI002A7491F1|nr:hypothetical protein [Chryseobacterium sp. JJR-5R]WPO81815.1 hypothetical protein SD427_13680 [Chryseobacterium sp. JJR-5R]